MFFELILFLYFIYWVADLEHCYEDFRFRESLIWVESFFWGIGLRGEGGKVLGVDRDGIIDLDRCGECDI